MNFKKSKHVQDSIRIIAVKRSLSLAVVIALVPTFISNAQIVPESPKTPTTTSTSSSRSTTSHSVQVDTDDDQHNSSVSISISDDSYKFRASYHKSKDDRVKAMLLNKLGKENLTKNGNTYLWSDNQNGDEIFECKLTKGHLRMYVDTEVASKNLIENINELGNDLKYFISGSDAKKEKAKATEKAKRDIEKAERELEHAKRELERAEREARRAKEK